MSLLLKALQNAAKNREEAAVGKEPAQAPAGNGTGAELTLEPVEPRPQTSAESRTAAPAADSVRAPVSTPQQAQSVLRAGAARAPEVRSPGVMDWIARRPLVAFSTAAGLFAIGYGTYLYLQLTNPGIFVTQPPPLPASPPPPANVAVTPPSAPPAAGTLQPQVGAPAPSGNPPPPASLLVEPPKGPPTAPMAPSAAVSGAPSSAPLASPAGPPGAQRPPPVPGARPEPPASPMTTAAGSSPASAAKAPARAADMPKTMAASPAAPRTGAADTSASAPASMAAPIPKEPLVGARPRPQAAAAPARKPTEETPATPTQVVTVDAGLMSAYQALEKGQLDEAERLYRQALATEPRSTDAMLGLASALAQRNRSNEATQLYLRVLEQDPRNTYAQAGLLNIGGRADPIAAETRLKQLIAREPSAYLYFSLGNLYAEQRQWAAAQGAYFQAVRLAPDNADYAFNLAVGLENLSQPKLALDYYRKAVALAQARGHAQFPMAPAQTRIRSLESMLAERP